MIDKKQNKPSPLLCSRLLTVSALLVMVVSVIVLSGGCASTDEGAIPITTTSKKARGYFLEGRDLAERLRRVEAHAYFEKALAEDSLFALAHLFMALVEPSARGFFERFEKAKALQDSVTEGERLLILATDAAVRGDQLAQEEDLEKLISLYPDDARAHNLLGQLYFGQQRYDLAIKQFGASIAIAPEYSSPYNQLGYCYRYINNLELAATTFEKYIALIPNDPNPHDSYAELLLKKGEFDRSLESYRRALALDAGFVESYLGIASNLCYQGRHKEARDELQRFYAVARNDGQRRRALYGIAASYIDEGLVDSAMFSLNKAKKIAEQIDDIRALSADFVAMGNLELERSNLVMALTLFNSALFIVNASDLDDLSREATKRSHLFNIARLAIKTGGNDHLLRADSLSDEFSKSVGSLSSIGQTALSHQLQGMLALEKQDYSAALSELAQANPLNPYNHYRKALAFRGQNDLQQAITELQIVVDFNSVLNINYALVRDRARALLDSLARG